MTEKELEALKLNCPYGRSECDTVRYNLEKCTDYKGEGFERCPVFVYFRELVDKGIFCESELPVRLLRLWENERRLERRVAAAS